MKYCYNCMEIIGNNETLCSRCLGNSSDRVSPLVLKPGSLLNNGQYLIGKAIGQGGFGITYIGRDLFLNRLIAVKEFFPNSCAVRDNHISNDVQARNQGDNLFDLFRNKYIEEARILARFGNEPAVVNVFNVLQENNTAYIIMNYLNGTNLREYVQKNGPFDAKELCRKMFPIMETLRKIHMEKIIHRDISPDNIMILQNGTLVLLDFGAARYYSKNNSLTVVLKADYAPVEQYGKNDEQGPWTDVYALSATIYYCLTGSDPIPSIYRGTEQNDALVKLSALIKNMDPDIEECILKGMAIDKENRYQDMTEMREHFDKAISDDPLPPPNPELLSLFAEADLHYLTGSADNALNVLLRVLKADPDNYSLNARMGIILSQLGLADQAILYTQKAKKNSRPHTALTTYTDALVKDNCGDWTQATNLYERAISQAENSNPKDFAGSGEDLIATMYLLYARCLGKGGQFDNVSRCIHKAMNRNTDTALFRSSVLSICELFHINPALFIQPTSLVSIIKKADQYYNSKEYQKSLDALLTGLKVVPDNRELLLKAGRAYRVLGQYNEAMTYYNKVLELHPDYAVTYLNIAILKMFEPGDQSAKGYFEKAVSLIETKPDANADVNFGTVYGNYAYYLIQNGDRQNGNFFLYMAAKKGYSEDSIRYLCKLLGVNPDSYLQSIRKD